MFSIVAVLVCIPTNNVRGFQKGLFWILIYKHLYKWLLKKLLNIVIINPFANHLNNWITNQNSSLAIPVNSRKAWNSE